MKFQEKNTAVISDNRVFISFDSCATWNARDLNRKWSKIVNSSDKVKLAEAVIDEKIYTSRDAGATWTKWHLI